MRQQKRKARSSTLQVAYPLNINKLFQVIYLTIFCALVLVIWELSVRSGIISDKIWSSPSQIITAAQQNWRTLFLHLYVTSYEALIGFVLAIILGILLGIGLFLFSWVNTLILPILSSAQTLPLVTIAPFFLWWFGFGTGGKIALVTLFSIFPIALQTSRGLLAVPHFFVDVALTCGASRWWTLWNVQIRVAMRQIFSGIRIAGTYIFATAATAEYMGSRRGIGIWLQSAYNSFQPALVWLSTFAIIALTGFIILTLNTVEYCLIGKPIDDLID